MSRANDLRAQADALDAEDALIANMLKARESVRADPDNEDLVAEYREAQQELWQARQTIRMDRLKLAIVAEQNPES
jgi:hypothetical protein